MDVILLPVVSPAIPFKTVLNHANRELHETTLTLNCSPLHNVMYSLSCCWYTFFPLALIFISICLLFTEINALWRLGVESDVKYTGKLQS